MFPSVFFREKKSSITAFNDRFFLDLVNRCMISTPPGMKSGGPLHNGPPVQKFQLRLQPFPVNISRRKHCLHSMHWMRLKRWKMNTSRNHLMMPVGCLRNKSCISASFHRICVTCHQSEDTLLALEALDALEALESESVEKSFDAAGLMSSK